MHKELHLKAESIRANKIKTIYFGGGTPSAIGAEHIKFTLNQIRLVAELDKNAEITVEANPEDLKEPLLVQLLEAGVNRLSIGIQSLQDHVLMDLNRAHSAIDALIAIQLVRRIGFRNVSVDLMFGLPGQSQQSFMNDLHQISALDLEHISLYSLTIESKTVFGRKVHANQMPAPDEALQVECFLSAEAYLEKLGYEHYEISNYAKLGYRSRHNSSYWAGTPYYGLGPGAHSYDGKKTRSWNISSTGKYIQELQKGILPETKEVLKDEDVLNEWIMTRIRQKEGLNLSTYQDMTGKPFQLVYKKVLDSMQAKKWLTLDGEFLKLTTSGRLYADSIAMEFFS